MPAHVKRNKSRSGESTVGYKTVNYTFAENIFRYLVQLCGLHFICVVGLTFRFKSSSSSTVWLTNDSCFNPQPKKVSACTR